MPKGGRRGEYYPGRMGRPKKSWSDKVEIRVFCEREFRDELDRYLASKEISDRSNWIVDLIKDRLSSNEY